MQSDTTIATRSQDLAALMEKKLGIKGRGLETKLRRGRRKLPSWVRSEAQQLVEAERLLAHPKLAARAQALSSDQSFRKCESWLQRVDLSEQRKTFWLSLLATNAFNLLFVGAAFLVTAHLAGVL